MWLSSYEKTSSKTHAGSGPETKIDAHFEWRSLLTQLAKHLKIGDNDPIPFPF